MYVPVAGAQPIRIDATIGRCRAAGMPKIRENSFSTDLYHLFRSTDITLIYGRINGFLDPR